MLVSWKGTAQSFTWQFTYASFNRRKSSHDRTEARSRKGKSLPAIASAIIITLSTSPCGARLGSNHIGLDGKPEIPSTSPPICLDRYVARGIGAATGDSAASPRRRTVRELARGGIWCSCANIDFNIVVLRASETWKIDIDESARQTDAYWPQISAVVAE